MALCHALDVAALHHRRSAGRRRGRENIRLAAHDLVVTWLPKLGRIGAERGRFLVLGFVATFVGVFVSATGTIVAPFVASAAPDRRNHAATLGALMIFVHTAKMLAFGFLGFAIAAYLPLMFFMIVAGAAGNW